MPGFKNKNERDFEQNVEGAKQLLKSVASLSISVPKSLCKEIKIDWKRPLSSSPTINPSLPCPLKTWDAEGKGERNGCSSQEGNISLYIYIYTPMHYLVGTGQVVNCRMQPALHAVQSNSAPHFHGISCIFSPSVEFARSELPVISNQIPIHIITLWHCISGCTTALCRTFPPASNPPFQEE